MLVFVIVLQIHIDAAAFKICPSPCEPDVVAAPALIFQEHVEKHVNSADESKALSKLRSRCGLGSTVVDARVNNISTNSVWKVSNLLVLFCLNIQQQQQETLVCVPFFRTSFKYGDRTFELLIHGVSGAVAGTRPYGGGLLGVAAKKVMEGVRAVGEWLVGLVSPSENSVNNGGNNNNE